MDTNTKKKTQINTEGSKYDDEEARDRVTFAVLIQEGKLGTLQEAKTSKQVCT